MRVLVLSSSEWSDDNSFGSTYSNLFGNIPDLELANIYCSGGLPKTDTCHLFFQINERLLLRNLFDSARSTGKSFRTDFVDAMASYESCGVNKKVIMYDFARKRRWIVFFWLRDLIWFVGKWKSEELIEFIDDFKPDLIFLPVYYSSYLNRIGLFLKSYTQKPMVGYISDDCYTLKQFSLSPLFWINRLFKRRWVKKAIDRCDKLYVISEVQKREYDEIFSKDSKILFKGGRFTSFPAGRELSRPLRMVYTGNLSAGRYKSLSEIGRILDAKKADAQLLVYSKTLLTSKMRRVLFRYKRLKFCGSVSSEDIEEIQSSADILVHVESFGLKDRLLVRHSFSTKIVDYFQRGKCIFAVGWKEAASISYLIRNDAAVVATSKREIGEKLDNLLDSPDTILEYGKKSWECGRRNHQIDIIQKELYSDMLQLVRSNSEL